MNKKFSEYVQEATLAEKDVEKGRFEVEENGDEIIFRYFKGSEVNLFQMIFGPEENLSIQLRVNNKEVIMGGLPKQKFILKMREFVQKIK